MEKTAQSSHADAAITFKVLSDKVELPRGSRVTVLPGVPVVAGDLVMFQIGSYESIGRWRPGLGGINWILQPDRIIALTGDEVCQVLVRVVPC